MRIETWADGARMVGENVGWTPSATYPVHVDGLGGLTLDGAWRLRNDLTGIVNGAEQGMRITVESRESPRQLTDMTVVEATQLRDELTTALRLAAEETL